MPPINDAIPSPTRAPAENSGILSEIRDFGAGLFDGAIQKPADGIAQIANHAGLQLPSMEIVRDDGSLGMKAGQMLGSVADFLLLSKVVGGSLSKVGLEGAPLTSSIVTGATTGAAFGLISPISDQGNFWVNKARTVGIDAGTFAVMSGASAALSGAPAAARLSQSGFFGNLLTKGTIGAASGIAGGLTSSLISDGLYGNKIDPAETAKTMGYYGLFGAAMGVADAALGSAAKAVSDANSPETFDAQGRATKLMDESGRALKIQYDDQGNVVRVEKGSDYSSNGRSIYSRQVDPSGQVTWTDTWKGLDSSDPILGPSFNQGSGTLEQKPFTMDADNRGITFTLNRGVRTMYNDGQTWSNDDPTTQAIDRETGMAPRAGATPIAKYNVTESLHLRAGEPPQTTYSTYPTNSQIQSWVDASRAPQAPDDGLVGTTEPANGQPLYLHFDAQGKNPTLISENEFNSYPAAQRGVARAKDPSYDSIRFRFQPLQQPAGGSTTVGVNQV